MTAISSTAASTIDYFSSARTVAGNVFSLNNQVSFSNPSQILAAPGTVSAQYSDFVGGFATDYVCRVTVESVTPYSNVLNGDNQSLVIQPFVIVNATPPATLNAPLLVNLSDGTPANADLALAITTYPADWIFVPMGQDFVLPAGAFIQYGAFLTSQQTLPAGTFAAFVQFNVIFDNMA